jgi:hypothetical protein
VLPVMHGRGRSDHPVPRRRAGPRKTAGPRCRVAGPPTGVDGTATAVDTGPTNAVRRATAVDRVATGVAPPAGGADQIATGENRTATVARGATGVDGTATVARGATGVDRTAMAVDGPGRPHVPVQSRRAGRRAVARILVTDRVLECGHVRAIGGGRQQIGRAARVARGAPSRPMDRARGAIAKILRLE